MNIPYIGVTDFTNRTQVERAKAAIPTGVDRRLHVGAMTSYKVIHGIPTSKGWENVWLNERGLRELFTDDPDVYNVIHYADYGHTETERAPTSVEDLLKAWDQCGPYVHAMQLDMVWPRVEMLEEFLHCRPACQLVLQVSTNAIKEGGQFWYDNLRHYKGLVEYVLVDTGMGRGTTFDPTEIIKTLNAVTWNFTKKQLAVAGGLGPDTYQNLKPILNEYPEISCDAQGRLRPSHSALDPLNMDYVEQYIKGVCSLLTNVDD
jgi:hypothetical protein